MMQRKNFSFRFEWQQAIAHLAPLCRLEIYEAAVRYAETGETGPLSAEAAEAFEQYIMPDFRRRAKAAEYRARRKARLAAKSTEEPITPNPPTTPISPTTPPKITPIIFPGPNRRERRLMAAEQKRHAKRQARKKLFSPPG
ncbi:MAG: hypothetical protein HDS72_06085 [Bacteroidales bacterium]|nr:hypothetical protein [Bacteroidales bacterium]